jgi:DNA-binding PadR family transcriptional regulator
MARPEGAKTERDEPHGRDLTAMRSPVAWALLGLVIERRGYGYELVKRFEREYGDVLPIKSDWHIYRAIDALKTRGLIEEVPGIPPPVTDGGRQPKPHYRGTDEGIRRYTDWLVSHFGPRRRQMQLFARQLAVLARMPDVALDVIDRYERACLAESNLSMPDTRKRDVSLRLAERLAAEESRLFLAAALPWLHYARGQLREAAAEAKSVHDTTA